MTNLKKSKLNVNVGVDVGKWFLDVCLYEKDMYWQVENTPEGIRKLLVMFRLRYRLLPKRIFWLQFIHQFFNVIYIFVREVYPHRVLTLFPNIS